MNETQETQGQEGEVDEILNDALEGAEETEKAKEEKVVKRVFTPEEINEAKDKKDGSLGKLLEEASTEPLEGPGFRAFKLVYKSATNRQPCPCGSGELFKTCCKVNWNLLQRTFKNKKNEERDTHRKEAIADSHVTMQLIIDVHDNGIMMIKDGEGNPVHPKVLEDVLHTAWLNAFTSVILQATQMQTAKIIEHVAGQRPAPQGQRFSQKL